MESIDSLKRNDEVTVKIFNADNNLVYSGSGSGYHSLEQAIESSIQKVSENIIPEDCVFEVTNATTDISHKYRLNAHGNIKLIV